MNRINDVLEEKGIKQTWLAENQEKISSFTDFVQNLGQPKLELIFQISEYPGLSHKGLLVKRKK